MNYEFKIVYRRKHYVFSIMIIYLLYLVFEVICDDAVKVDQGYINKICRDVENIRNKKFKQTVRGEVQDAEGIRKYIVSQIREQYGEDEGYNYAAALFRLGLLKEPINFKDVIMDIVQKQAAAYYCWKEKKIYIMKNSVIGFLSGMVIAHELSHALQDQYYDLEKFLGIKLKPLNSDSIFTKGCVIEGEATYIMLEWFLKNSGMISMLDNSLKSPALEMLKIYSDYEIEDIVSFMKVFQGKKTDIFSSSIFESICLLEKSPLYFTEMLLSPYLKGSALIARAITKYGIDGIDKLFSNPPVTSNDIIHMDKFFNDNNKREQIDILSIKYFPFLKGWKLLYTDIVGEFGLRIYFKLWKGDCFKKEEIYEIAKGWKADRYMLYGNKTGYLLVWDILWDSHEDLAEFLPAYISTLKQRFISPEMIKDVDGYPIDVIQTYRLKEDRWLQIRRRENKLRIIDTDSNSILYSKF